MKADKLKYGNIKTLNVLWGTKEGTLNLRKYDEVSLIWSNRAGSYLLRTSRGAASVVPSNRKSRQLMHELCVRNVTRVIWILSAEKDSLILQVHIFQHEIRLGISISVTEQAVDKARRLNQRIRVPGDLVNWLEGQCLLKPCYLTETRAFVSVGRRKESNYTDGFVLHGCSIRVFVKKEIATSGDGFMFVVDRIARARGKSYGAPIVHAEGQIQFTDGSVSAWIRGDGVGELRELVTTGKNFLDLWSKYGELEASGILKQARSVGGIAYQKYGELTDGNIWFDVSADPETIRKISRLGVDDQLSAGSEVPAILEDPVMTWSKFEKLQRGKTYKNAESFHGALVKLPKPERKIVVLKPTFDCDEHPPKQGFLYPSILGDRIRLERRRKAEERIRELKCNLPVAHLLLGARVPVPRRKEIRALTPRVRKKLFGELPPTLQQKEAIHVALNTPEIAVIQGPPGTGKTKVIEAITERLNDELDTLGAGAGQILVTGFQHDAVENALSRIDVNGLPAIKFGSRNNQDEYKNSQDKLDQWGRERAEQIRTRMPSFERSDIYRQLTSALESYMLVFGQPSERVRLLNRVISLVGGEVSASLLDRVRSVIEDMELQLYSTGKGRSDHQPLERTVRALRVEPAGFADDGPINAQRLLIRLQRSGKIGQDCLELLERAASWTDETVPDFLPELAKIRKQLLLEVVPDRSALFFPASARRDVVDVLADLREDLEQHYLASREAPDAAVYSYLRQLENNIHSLRRAVIHYSSVFGATCQQAASRVMTQVKSEFDYDSVLVDEAARANPLDLFIPMSQARRRIILVGDHRQLPHIIDRKLQRDLETEVDSAKSLAEETKDFIERSLFEHLFRDLCKRTEARRVVTLDVQFRMHPVLGEFVSREFYEAHGDPKIKSGLPAKNFYHELPGYEGRVAAWYNVPPEDGREIDKHSKSRPAEAVAVARELKRLMDDPAAEHLTFGCITFYAAQTDCIYSALTECGVSRKEDNRYEITEEYRYLRLPDERLVERLRIGTVDAFQGKEFDVVLLSVVRSNDCGDTNEGARRRRYGHLMSPNRLCVSMSRQKRLLILFGDPTLLDAPNAKEAIGPLVRFRRELCRG